MPLKVEIQIKGGAQVQARLKKLGSSLYDFKKPMGEIGEQSKYYFQNNAFNSQGGVFKARWPDLSPTYATYKRKKWGNRPILVASGQMRKSFYHKAYSDHVIVTNLAKQFKYHQSAASRSRLPRRQMIGINAPIKKIVQTTLKADIEKKLRAD